MPSDERERHHGDDAVGQQEAGDRDRAEHVRGDGAAERGSMRSMSAAEKRPRGASTGSRSASSTAVAAQAEPMRSYAKHQQRDVAYADSERALEVGREEPAGAALRTPEIEDAAHSVLDEVGAGHGGYGSATAGYVPVTRG